ncbi:hypothetical protein HDU90_002125 [Geranomyces variabilis]|nr:hypothetical protein HDU90_002125 [Geranomyces variabilis]
MDLAISETPAVPALCLATMTAATASSVAPDRGYGVGIQLSGGALQGFSDGEGCYNIDDPANEGVVVAVTNPASVEFFFFSATDCAPGTQLLAKPERQLHFHENPLLAKSVKVVPSQYRMRPARLLMESNVAPVER